ncbi:MAG: hypothetical protein KDA32_05560 [Phycisphaerales bacterium]|nr:hypothetical protein [Phycisphaerales bacterium]
MSANRDKVVEIISTLLEIPESHVTDDLAPGAVEHWDSINHLNICVAAGQEFGVDLSAEEMAGIGRVGDLVKTLAAKGVEFK